MRLKLLFIILISVGTLKTVNSQIVKIVYDIPCIEQVVMNFGSSVGAEELMKKHTDSIKVYNERTAQSALAIQLVQTAYMQSLQDRSSFSKESENYKHILKLMSNITGYLNQIYTSASSKPHMLFSSSKFISEMTNNMIGLLIKNAKLVMNIDIDYPGADNQKDGLNLIDVKKRLELTEYVINELREIEGTCRGFAFHLEFAKEADLVRNLVPLDHYYINQSIDISRDIVNTFTSK